MSVGEITHHLPLTRLRTIIYLNAPAFNSETVPHRDHSIFVQHSNHRESFQQICAVGGLIKTGGQIYASNMQHLMPAILPQETTGYVIYFALVGYEGRCPILAVVLGKFPFREPSQLQDTLWLDLRGLEDGFSIAKSLLLPDNLQVRLSCKDLGGLGVRIFRHPLIWGSWTKGRRCANQGLPDADSDPTA
jgi:hypothetical protein